MLIWEQKQASCDKLLWKYLTNYASKEQAFGGAAFIISNVMTFKNTK